MRSLRSWATPVLAALLAGCGRGCADSPPGMGDASDPGNAVGEARPVGTVDRAAPLSEARPHVVLVSLDTTRADRLGAYGYDGAHTPTLDALAASGRRYARAYAPVPLTIPSHAALLTGTHPARFGLHVNGDGVLPPEAVTLAERLGAAGWATAASVGAYVTTRVWGFDQGYDRYADDLAAGGDDNLWHAERPAARVVDDALAQVAQLRAERPGAPIHLWVHLYDAHEPYAPDPRYLALTDGRPYDAELAAMDDAVARLVTAFAGEPVMWVIVGDHGESLGEHDELTHGLLVYEAVARVPFLLVGPGVAPEVVGDVVGLADVAPTVLDLLGLPLPSGDGVPARPGDPALAGRGVPVSSWQLTRRLGLAPHLGLVRGALKLIDLPSPELYDVVADPAEAHNLAAGCPSDCPPAVAELSAARRALELPAPGPRATAGGSGVPGATAALAALGYVEGTVDVGGALPDPKTALGLLAGIGQLDRLTRLGRDAEVLALLKELVAAWPDRIELRVRLAGALATAGDLDAARALVTEALAEDPGHPQLRAQHAALLGAIGALDQAADAWTALALDAPLTPRVLALAVRARRFASGLDAAVQLAEDWRARYPDDRGLAGVLGILAVEAGRHVEAEALLREGAGAGVIEPDVAYLLAAKALGEGDVDGGLKWLDVELRAHPGHLRARQAAVRALASLGRWAEVAASARAGMDHAPGDADLAHFRTLALFNLGRLLEAREAVDAGLAAHPAHPHLMLMDANLLAAEGRREAGEARFQEAQAALQATLGPGVRVGGAMRDVDAAGEAFTPSPVGLEGP